MRHLTNLFRAAPLALFCLTAPATAQDEAVTFSDEWANHQYGIMCFYDDAAPSVPLPFEQVTEIFWGDGEFDDFRVSATLTVPAVPGIVIGVASAMPDGVSFNGTSIITHTNLNGQVSEDRAKYLFDSSFEIDSWVMDASNPADQGSYRFQVMRGTTTLYDLTFTIVPVAAYTGPYPNCISRP